MSWETVKAFCRRQNQSFSERYRNVSKTEDLETEGAIQRVLQLATISFNTAERMQKIAVHLDAVTGLLDAMQADFSNFGVAANGTIECAGALLVTSKKLELTVQDMQLRCAALTKSFGDAAGPLRKFSGEANQLHVMTEDRKEKMLEYDFFRNKVAALRASPPSDAARIPRNEARLADWQRAYDEANQRVRRTAHMLTENGSRALLVASGALTADLGRYYDDVARSARITLLSQSLGDRATAAMASATLAAAENVNKVVPPAAQRAAQAAVAGGLAAMTSPHFRPDADDDFAPPPPPSSSSIASDQSAPGARRRAKSNFDDDPFRV